MPRTGMNPILSSRCTQSSGARQMGFESSMLMLQRPRGRDKVGWSNSLCLRELTGGLTEKEAKFKLVPGRRGERRKQQDTVRRKDCLKMGRRRVWWKPVCMGGHGRE